MSEVKNTIEETMDILSQKHGIDIEDLRSSTEDWVSDLMTKGVIVKLQLGRWRANKKIEPEDIGLNIEDERVAFFQDRYLRLGSRRLLPDQYLRELATIEKKARDNLKEYSFETIWGKFVPSTSFDEWKEENDKIRKEYFDSADKMVKDWEDIIDEIDDDYAKFAKALYQDYVERVELKNRTFNNEQEFIDSYLEASKRDMVSPEEFRESFEYENFYYFIPVPAVLSGEDSIKEEMSNVKDEILSKKNEYLDSFLNSTAGELRRTVSNVTSQIKTNLEKSENITNRTKKKIINLINQVKNLNFYEDSEVESALNKLKLSINKDKDEISKKEIIANLESVESLAKGEIQEIVIGKFKKIETNV